MKKSSSQHVSRVFHERDLYLKILISIVWLAPLSGHISSPSLLAQSSADFTVHAYPNYFEVSAGQTVTYPIFCNSTDNFVGNILLSLSGAPAGVIKSYVFSINPVQLTANATVESDLTITTNSKAQPGYYSFMVDGSSSSLSHSSKINLSLLPSASSIPPSFLISLFIPMLLVALISSKNKQPWKPNPTSRHQKS